MEFSWTSDQLAFRASVIDFARDQLGHDVVAADAANDHFSRDTWQKCAAVGLTGFTLPDEYGGQGADARTTMLAMEALGYGCRDNGLIFSINAHLWSAAMPILRFGTEAQKDQYLPGLASGELIGVQAMTEPDTGSDAFSLRTEAKLTDDGYKLSGSKTYITNAPVADVFVVFASTNPKLGAMGLSAFLVERDTPGLTVGKPFTKMGLRTSPMSELFFDDCLVDAERMLGKPGNGMAIFNHSIDWERACILASVIGTMDRQIETAIEYAKQREQFGKPIGDFQAVSHRIVDMKVRADAGRMLLYRAGWEKDKAGGGVVPLHSAMAKLFISEAFVQSSLDLLQVHGGYGYMTESDIERDVRDAVASRIYSGTSDIQRNIIASALGL
ncbi:MAG: acyl-CoA dehydrogenase [Acidimicrobiia bacterium]|nr:acyl-CoA dehydrogenase [Acidimicrobiia bacterium]